MYLDLSPRRRFDQPQVVQSKRHYQPPRPFGRRLALYGVALLVGGALVVWSTGQVSAIEASTTAEQSQLSQSTERRLIEALVTSEIPATTLAERGVGLLRHSGAPAEASLYLQAAAAKDTKFRDAALYAGFAELQLADPLWQSDAAQASRHTKSAITFLELARSIDPIYPYTFELLEIAYTNMGQAELAAEAKGKAEQFTQQT